MITNAGVLAALIAHEQIAFPDWKVFGDPEVIFVEAGPFWGPQRMVRVMLLSGDADSDDDQEFFLVTTWDDQIQVYAVPHGPWGSRNGIPMISHVSHLVGSCYELKDLSSVPKKAKS